MRTAFQFLEDLAKNNNRDWFQSNKKVYELAHMEVIDFAQKLYEEMLKHDNIEETNGKKSLFRIYRDVRFSKDKTPYKTSWSGRFKRATNELRGGYYFHLEKGNTFVAGGFWQPNSQDLLHIRKQIQQDSSPLREIINSQSFKKYFSELKGEKVKTAPKGFEKNDPDIDLIKHKGYILTHSFNDEEVLDPNFALKMSDGFRNMRPFLNYMTEILITDLNGIPLV